MPTLRAEHERVVVLADDGLGLAVVLVANLADQLLDDVLDGHEAGRAAVLVDDDRELKALLLELAQQIDDALRLGHERRRPHDLRDLARARRLARSSESGPSRR